MEQMIKQILDIEKRAHDVVEEAREKQTHLDEEVEQVVQELKQDWTAKMNKKIASLREQETQMTKEKLKQLEQDTMEKKQKLDRLYQENEETWVNMLFDDIFRLRQ